MNASTNPPRSKNGVPIRLPDERWEHILEEHGELQNAHEAILQTIADPQKIFAGNNNELLAISETIPGKWLVVVYRENENDGFVITAFFTRRYRALEKRRQIWP